MKYAVIKTGGKQYKGIEGQTLEIEKLKQASSKKDLDKNSKIHFNEVLLLVEDNKAKIGQPFVDAKVSAKVIDQIKDKKINILKYKAKTGYSRRMGHRQTKTKVLIEKIGAVMEGKK